MIISQCWLIEEAAYRKVFLWKCLKLTLIEDVAHRTVFLIIPWVASDCKSCIPYIFRILSNNDIIEKNSSGYFFNLNPFLHPKGLYRPWPLQGLVSTTCLKQKIAGFLSNCSFFCLLHVEILTQHKLIIFFKIRSFFSEVSKTRVCVNFRVCRK